jgi:hypothetical protein
VLGLAIAMLAIELAPVVAALVRKSLPPAA